MPHLIVLYGPPLAGKSLLAQAVASALEGKSAVVSLDGLLGEAISNHDPDALAELEMVHTQARLLVANYLKNRYHVVLEGAFCYERQGVIHHREHEIDQIVSLMRNMAPSPVIARLSPSLDVLRQRAEAAGADTSSVLRVSDELKPRYGGRSLELDSGTYTVQALVELVVETLETA